MLSMSQFAHDLRLQFIKTPRFLALKIQLRNDDDELDEYSLTANASTPSVPPGLNEEEVGGAYMTVSQRAAAVMDRPT